MADVNVTISASKGIAGADGREIEIQNSGTHLQWRYEGDVSWTNLVALSAITGPTGARGITPQGVYDSLTAYVVDDIVTHNGNMYICVQDTQGNSPNNVQYWTRYVAKGEDGDQGAEGPQGATGPAGAGSIFFLSNKSSGVGDYKTITSSPTGLSETTYSAVLETPNTEYLLATFITNGNYSSSHINSGEWEFHVNSRVSASGGITQLVFKVYIRTDVGVETLLFQATSDDIDNTTNEIVETTYALSTATDTNITDDIVIKVYGITTSTSDRTIYLTVDGTNKTSHIETTLSNGFDPEVYFQSLPTYSNNSAAITAGLGMGSPYIRTDGLVAIVI